MALCIIYGCHLTSGTAECQLSDLISDKCDLGIIKNLDNWIKFLSMEKKHYYSTTIMYYTIIIITAEKTCKTLNLKKSNNDVCLADAYFGCGDLVN
jgi:hypothetical protein